MNTYDVIEQSIPGANRLKTSNDRNYTETNFYFSNSRKSNPIKTTPNAKSHSNANYYSQRKEKLTKTLVKKRLITSPNNNSNSSKYLSTHSTDLESYINIGYNPRSLITSYKENSKSGRYNTQHQDHNNKINNNSHININNNNNNDAIRSKLISELESKQKESLRELALLKTKEKENEDIIKKMIYDNTHLTKVNKLLIEEVNELKSFSQIKYDKLNKENERLAKEIESLKRLIATIQSQYQSQFKHKKIEEQYSASSSTSSHYIQKLNMTIESYKNQNNKYKLIISNLEDTIEKLVKENIELSHRSETRSIESSITSLKEYDHQYNNSNSSNFNNESNNKRKHIINMLERQNELLEQRVKELEDKLALFTDMKRLERKSNIRIEDNAIVDNDYDSENDYGYSNENNGNDRETGIILHRLFDHLCHLLKKKKISYSNCKIHKEELAVLIEEIQDEIQMLFIKKHYTDESMQSQSKHNDNY